MPFILHNTGSRKAVKQVSESFESFCGFAFVANEGKWVWTCSSYMENWSLYTILAENLLFSSVMMLMSFFSGPGAMCTFINKFL